MKKLTAVFALSMALTFAFAGCSESKGTGMGGNAQENQLHNSFISEIGGVSETYKGSISNKSYYSKEEAAEGYVMEELAGDSNVNIINTTSKQEYYGPAAVDNVIKQQKLPIEDTSDIVSIEQMEVTYSVDGGDTYASPMAMTSNSNKKVTVYVIKYTTHWEYYSPVPVTGNTITKSYYDSVFNSDAWENCTYENTITLNLDMTASYGGQTQTIKTTETFTQKAWYNETAVLFEQTKTTTSDELSSEMFGSLLDYPDGTYAVYMEIVEDGEDICYVKTPESLNWQEGDLYMINFSSIEDLRPFAGGYLDYSYFTKTDYGFELSSENATKYLNEAMGSGMESLLSQGVNMDMFVKYYVSQGVLSGMRLDYTVGMNMSQQGMTMKMNMLMTSEASVKNYGTTIVQKPADIVD
jgi:hypothetical protein